jgi:uncharacterized membrane protein YphA (DoxX/SURF4 family)
MSIKLSPRALKALDLVTVLARWFVGAAFIYLGVLKLQDPVQFLKLVRQYELVHTPWMLNSIAATLPWFEVVCGVLLIAGVAVRGAALNLLLMLIPFTAIVLKRALAMAAAQQLPFCAVSFDCGCGTGEVNICQKMFENSALIVLSFWLLAGRGRQLCARYSLAGRLADSRAAISAPSATSECPG